jgi:hypothetical protein
LRCGLPEGFQTSFVSARVREVLVADLAAVDLPDLTAPRSSRSSRGVLRFLAAFAGFTRFAAAAFFAASCLVEVFLGSVLLATRSRSSFRARGFFLGEVLEVMKPFR